MKRLVTRIGPGLLAVLVGLGSSQPVSRVRRRSANPRPSGSRSVILPQGRAKLIQGYGKLPLSFEPNLGQFDPSVEYLSRGTGYTLFLTGDEAVLALKGPHPSVVSSQSVRAKATDRGPGSDFRTPMESMAHPLSETMDAIRLKLVAANAEIKVEPSDELPGKSNYFIGNDPKKWRTNVPNFARVSYRDIYPGVDLVYYGNQGQLEYDFVVAPRADPKAIALAVEAGSSRHDKDGGIKPPLRIDAAGELAVNTEGGEVRFRKPVVYQEELSAVSGQLPIAKNQGPRTTDQGPGTPLNHQSASSNRQFRQGRYVLTAGNRVSFQIADYDRSRPLIIDPVLSYSTYLGGSGDDSGNAIAVDASGNAYVTGSTASTNFPTASPLQASLVPSDNNCHVTGHISGIGSFSRTVPCSDVFVTKLDAKGTMALYSTYLGGSNFDSAQGIAADSSGNVYLTGSTSSTDFPTTAGAFDTTCGTGSGCNLDANGNVHPDAFVAKLGPAGDVLVYSTYLGGKSAGANARGIAVDPAGNAYVTGSTASTDFPTSNPFQKALGGTSVLNAFVSKLNATGSALIYSTYLGGSGGDGGGGVAVDFSGNAYVAGSTISTDFPTTPGAFKTTCGTDSACNPDTNGNKQSDAFVTKFDPSGLKLLYSTYLLNFAK